MLRSMLATLKTNLGTALKSYRDRVCFNSSALMYLGREYKARNVVFGVEEVEQVKEGKKRVRVVS